MSETIKLAAMVVRHGGEEWSDAVREAFVEQAVRARDEHDAMKAEVEAARAENATLRALAMAVVGSSHLTSDTRHVTLNRLRWRLEAGASANRISVNEEPADQNFEIIASAGEPAAVPCERCCAASEIGERLCRSCERGGTTGAGE